VVIGIFALLISILLPALNRAREAANKTACSSNMRQIGMAMVLYSNDWSGFLPTAEGVGADALDWGGVLVKNGYLGEGADPYDSKVFACPSDDRPRPWGKPRAYMGTRGHWLYLCGWAVGSPAKSCKLAHIRQASDFVMLSERVIDVPIMGYVNWSLSDLGMASSFHDRNDYYASNILFGDGHVGFVPGSQLLTNYDMWSRSGKWEDLSAYWLP
jgi:prepilin-type processing-associated H-X9-DG protein